MVLLHNYLYTIAVNNILSCFSFYLSLSFRNFICMLLSYIYFKFSFRDFSAY